MAQQQSLRKLEAEDFVNSCRNKLSNWTNAYSKILICPAYDGADNLYKTWKGYRFTFDYLNSKEYILKFSDLEKPSNWYMLSEEQENKIKTTIKQKIKEYNEKAEEINDTDGDLIELPCNINSSGLLDVVSDENAEKLQQIDELHDVIDEKLKKIKFKEIVNTKEKEELTDLIFTFSELVNGVTQETISTEFSSTYPKDFKRISHACDVQYQLEKFKDVNKTDLEKELANLVEEEEEKERLEKEKEQELTKSEKIIAVVFLLGILWLAWKVIMFFYHLFT